MAVLSSLRKAYGEALIEVGKKNPDIIALDADLGKSTFSRSIMELGEERFIEMGIAEQNMASVSAGLAFTGKVPFFSTFAVFVTGRAYDQIRSSICIPNLNVNICGSSCGLSDYGDGKTHQSIDDIALMQVLPNMTVLTPMDANQVYGMVEAMANHDGPCYLRVPRNDLPVVSERETYRIGQLDVLKESKDVAIVACGAAVHTALDAAEQLGSKGIDAGVVSVGTIKPFPVEEMREIASKVKALVVVEEHNVIGGLGSAVTAALAGMPLKIKTMGVQDSFGQSAENYELLVKYYGLTAEDVASTAAGLLAEDTIYAGVK